MPTILPWRIASQNNATKYAFESGKLEDMISQALSVVDGD